MIDRRPALIARCTSTADVAAAVNAAREHGLVVAVRCGGHSFSGLSTCDDGMVIDLRGLKSITVDLQARTARAGGGVLWGEFDAATRAHGLHTPGGRVASHRTRRLYPRRRLRLNIESKYGLACDNLTSAEVVLADGSVVRASEREHADLFWGIRGGGNFGIVTEFEFRLHPLGPIVLAGLAMFPINRAPEVLRSWRDWAPDALAPYAGLFVVEGICAAVRGPVHRHLALLADALGDHEAAAASPGRGRGAGPGARRDRPGSPH